MEGRDGLEDDIKANEAIASEHIKFQSNGGDGSTKPSSSEWCKKTFSFLLGRVVLGCGKVEWQFESPEEAADVFYADLREDIQEQRADIYQVTSVLRCPRFSEQFPEEAETCSAIYSFRIWKCLLCALIQMFVTPLVAMSQLFFIVQKNRLEDYNVCQQNGTFDDVVGKLVAASFSCYLWILYVKEQEDNNDPSNAANYLIMERNRISHRINGMIYVWGYSVNLCSQFITSLSATILIYTAEDALNIILNALAIFFINELDDILATSAEYKRAKKLLQNVDDGIVEGLNHSSSEGQLRDIGYLFTPFRWNGMFMSVVTILVLTASPFYMITCYGTEDR